MTDTTNETTGFIVTKGDKYYSPGVLLSESPIDRLEVGQMFTIPFVEIKGSLTSLRNTIYSRGHKLGLRMRTRLEAGVGLEVYRVA